MTNVFVFARPLFIFGEPVNRAVEYLKNMQEINDDRSCVTDKEVKTMSPDDKVCMIPGLNTMLAASALSSGSTAKNHMISS
jgi:hypothetical protein